VRQSPPKCPTSAVGAFLPVVVVGPALAARAKTLTDLGRVGDRGRLRADVSVSEGDAGTASASFAVTLSAPSGREVDVDYATTDDTATVTDGDYSSTTGTLTFSPGQTSLNVDVPVVGDDVFEGDESYSVGLTGEVNGTLLDATAVGAIINDDAMPEASIDDVTVPEGDAGTSNATFAVTLSNASAFPVSLDWITVDATATAGSDYEASGGSIAFSPGETTKGVDVVVDGDVVQESDETVEVHLSNAGASDDQRRFRSRGDQQRRLRAHDVDVESCEEQDEAGRKGAP
jgi:hypothetical protein